MRIFLPLPAPTPAPQEPPPPLPTQPVLPDLRRRRSRSFPNSSLASALSVTDAASAGPLEVVAAADAVVVQAVDDDDRFEEVNVRSRQPVPEGESPPPQPPPSSTSSSSQHDSARLGGQTEERIDDSERGFHPGKRDSFVTSRQVFSHEERPCASVNYVTSPSIDEPSNDQASEQKSTSNKQLTKSETVGTVVKTPMSSDASASSQDKLGFVAENDDDDVDDSTSREARRKHSKEAPPHRPKSHQTPQQQLHKPQQQQQHKQRPKSHPKTSESQDETTAYDVSLSKMASETHRFISEGVAAAAAAAVDAVLTHTASAAAAAAASGKEGGTAGTSVGKDGAAASSVSSSSGSGSAGKKVKPGYGVYQPPKRRVGSVEEKSEGQT